MKKLIALTMVVCAASSVAFAQETVTSQKTETQATTAGGTSTKTTTQVNTTDYVNQMRTVYTTAGIAETKTERLIQLDRQLFEAYRAGDVANVRRIRMEIRQILGDDLTRVHTYIESNPFPGTYPDFIMNTYAPEASFTRDISITGSGAASNGVGVDANVNRSGSTGAIDANVSGRNNTGIETNTGATQGNPGNASGTGATGSNSGTGSSSTGATGSSNTGATGSSSTGATGSGTGATGSTGSSNNTKQ